MNKTFRLTREHIFGIAIGSIIAWAPNGLIHLGQRTANPAAQPILSVHGH